MESGPVKSLDCAIQMPPDFRVRTGLVRSVRAAAWSVLALVLWASAGCGGDATEAPAGPRVTHVVFAGEVDVGAQALVARAIREAHRNGSETLLVELDTPGGSVEVMDELQRVLNAAERDELRIACWVPHRAWSAGVLIALCASSFYMGPTATIGSSHPVLAGMDGRLELPDDPTIREKLVSPIRSQFEAQARASGRPPELAVAMVDPAIEVQQVKIDNELRLVADKEWELLRESRTEYEVVRTIDNATQILTLSAKEAVTLRFADGIAATLPEVLEKLGYRAGDATAPMERTASDRTVVWLDRLAPLLILAALVLGYLELKLPGFGLPGILSAACFLAVVAGKYLAGLADVPHVVAVAIGLVLIVVEVLVLPGTLWFGITGGLLLAGGLLFASIGPGFAFTDGRVWERVLDAGLEYSIAAVLAVAVAMTISRWLPKTPVLRRTVLVPDPAVAFGGGLPETAALPALGARGTALTDLRPVGKVAIDGRDGDEWEARSLGPFVRIGARVRVVEVGVGRLVVEAVAGENA